MVAIIVRRTFDDAALAHMIAERKRLYEILHPETKAEAFHGNRFTGSRRQVGDSQTARFSAATAKATGKSERTIQRAAQRGEALGADALLVVGRRWTRPALMMRGLTGRAALSALRGQ